MRTTWGSPIFADHVPPRSDIAVETLEARGAIVIGKSNTPEFGAGANTFNEVFGKTRNPWNTDKTCGGSSGGSSTALGHRPGLARHGLGPGRQPADSRELLQHLRLPPEPRPRRPRPQAPPLRGADGGRPHGAQRAGLRPHARRHERAPTRRTRSPSKRRPRALSDAVATLPPPGRIAYSPDLGLLPVDREVAAVCKQAAESLGGAGMEVAEACPDLSGALEVFQVLRAALFAADKGPLLETHRDALKPEIIWNIEKGLALDADTIARAERARGAIYQRCVHFFRRHDVLVCPCVIVPPFDVDTRWVDEIDGHRFDNYVDWLGLTFVLTLTACPSASVPVGFTEAGLPVGLQILGPPRGEAAVLRAAAAIEAAIPLVARTPIDPRGPDGAVLAIA